jgi:hypothetical protein
MTINQNPLTGEVDGYDESTYSRKCECGEDIKMLFLYISTETENGVGWFDDGGSVSGKEEIFRLEKYEEDQIPDGYKYSPVMCSPICSN